MAKPRFLPSPLAFSLGGEAKGGELGVRVLHADPVLWSSVLMDQRDLIGMGGKSPPGMRQGMGLGLSSCKMGFPAV